MITTDNQANVVDLTESQKVDAYAFRVKWRKISAAQNETLQLINKRLSKSWDQVVAAAEANTKRLTGQSRF